MHQTSYQLFEPAQLSSCVVFASPHSGRAYPIALKRQSALGELALRSSEDAFVDHLVGDVVTLGAPLLSAVSPRAFVDLNRAAEELDPALIAGAPPARQNPRISSGLGVIPRVVSNGRAIYTGKISLAEARQRIDTVWRPYHTKLQTLLNRAKMTFGQAVLIDCHSMPHEAVQNSCFSGSRPPEIVLGDRFGASAGPSILATVEAAFKDQGFRVARNAPFAGAYTAQHYGRPSRQQHVIQVEVDRALYMDEATLKPLPGYSEFRGRLTQALRVIADMNQPRQALAAE